ncbi:hypothetical protein [Microbacterium sorbitolivorans]|uniref:hypothetical protein n=1 Tax=Microbacterium sorbitolivorans TaxID=1867410 RepID=UPI0013B05606|nr:hypothetical protein [Microbacterium sorbitolivorans]
MLGGLILTATLAISGNLIGDTHDNPHPPEKHPDQIQNLSLALEPAEISSSTHEKTMIEVTGVRPGTFVDIEIAQPGYLIVTVSGVCPELTEGPCHLAYSGGLEADDDGNAMLSFPETPDIKLYPGTYEVTVRDRHTAQVISLDLKVSK